MSQRMPAMMICYRCTRLKRLYAIAFILFANVLLSIRFWPVPWPFANPGAQRGLLGPLEGALRARQGPQRNLANREDLSDAENFDHSYDVKYEELLYDKNSLKNFDSFTCSQLITGSEEVNKTAVEARNRYLKSHILHDAAFNLLAENCTVFTEKRKYFEKPVTDEELDFPLAYGIYMYKSVHQVEQLLQSIYRPQNVYCIHVDRKASPPIHRAMQAIAKCFDNVFIASRLARVTWCSIEVVRAELYCLSDLLKRREKWKYYLNLSGQEFPLKTNLEIVQILHEYGGMSDVISNSGRTNPERHKFQYFITKNGHIKNSTIQRTKPKPFPGPTYKGELHVALSRRFAEFILRSKVGQSWFAWLNDTLCPDEYFYQTLSRLPGVPGVLESNASSLTALTRFKTWKFEGAVDNICNGRFVRQICVYGWKDLPQVTAQPYLFANKFHADFDSVVLDCLGELIRNRTHNPIKLNLSVYRKFSRLRSAKAAAGAEHWVIRNQTIATAGPTVSN